MWPEGDDPEAMELAEALDEARRRKPDDVTLRRMWGRISELGWRRPSGVRWLWFAASVTGTAALAFALGGWLLPRGEPPAQQAAQGVSQTSEPAATDPGPAVLTPGTFRTERGETLRFSLRGGTKVQLGSPSASSVMSLDEEERPTLEGGAVDFKVPHQAPGHTFVVRVGPYRVLVVGTKFQLRMDDRQRVQVAVEEGTVEVWGQSRLARLEPGQHWESPETEAAAPAAPAALAVAPTNHARREAQHPRVVALAHPAASAETTTATAEGAAPSGADPTAQAHAALAAGDVQRALALFRALAQRGGPAGENAEYEIGKILRDRLGQPANAVVAWRHYRADHPTGILRVEADVSIIEALVHTGDADAALAEANDFLRHYPSSERRAEIARVAGDLYRTRGECAHAVAAYDAALAAPRNGGVVEAASFNRASCLVQLGDAGGADAARAYLKAWPFGRFRDQAAQLVAAQPTAEGRPRP
jgi:hypothetical protein